MFQSGTFIHWLKNNYKHIWKSWAAQQSRRAYFLLLKSKFSFFPNGAPYPGSLQAANLPMESCRTLQSCNRYAYQYHECTDKTNIFIIYQFPAGFHFCCYTCAHVCFSEWWTTGSTVTHEAWCPGPPAAPGSAFAEASTAGLKGKGDVIKWSRHYNCYITAMVGLVF